MRSGRFLWLLPTVLLAAVAYALTVTGEWLLVNVRPSEPWYIDLAQITYSADCPHPDAGKVGDRTCDPRNRPYNYPPVWAAAARFLGIGADDTVWVGGLLAAVGVTALAVFYLRFAGRPTVVRVAALAAMTCSPPMLLMICRGNVDLLMTALLVAAAVLTVARRDWWAAPVIALAAGLKLFPIGGLLSMRRWPALVCGVLSGLAILVLAGPWLAEIRAATPSGVRNSFGVGIVPAVVRLRELGGVFPVDQLAGLALFGLLYLGLFLTPVGRRVVTAGTAALHGDHVGIIAFLAGAGPFLAAYLFTNSFDYRLAPLLFVAVACLRTRSRGLHVLTAALVVVFWARFTPTAAQLIGDVVLIGVTPFIAAVATALVLERWEIHPALRLLRMGHSAV